MCAIYAYIGIVLGVNVVYGIHGVSGLLVLSNTFYRKEALLRPFPLSSGPPPNSRRGLSQDFDRSNVGSISQENLRLVLEGEALQGLFPKKAQPRRLGELMRGARGLSLRLGGGLPWASKAALVHCDRFWWVSEWVSHTG